MTKVNISMFVVLRKSKTIDMLIKITSLFTTSTAVWSLKKKMLQDANKKMNYTAAVFTI